MGHDLKVVAIKQEDDYMRYDPGTYFFIVCLLMFAMIPGAKGQKMEYSRANVFVPYSDYIQMAEADGHHHLLTFTFKENPRIFIFDNELRQQDEIHIPFKFPEKSSVSIVPFEKYYYLYIHTPAAPNYFLWRVDGNGNITDLSASLQHLVQSQFQNARATFYLTAWEHKFCMMYDTRIPEIGKNRLSFVQTDSLLTPVNIRRVTYDFRRNESLIKREVIQDGKVLLVLKTSFNPISLQMMKVDMNTGYTITNTFKSLGYYYAAPNFRYNAPDSAITVYSTLKNTGASIPENFVFISKMDNQLIEKTPFKILRSQFAKNETSNFVFFEGNGSPWINFSRSGPVSSASPYERVVTQSNPAAQYPVRTSDRWGNNSYGEDDPRYFPDQTIDPTYRNTSASPTITTLVQVTPKKYSTDAGQVIRFTLMDEKFKITNDTLFTNRKKSYAIFGDRYANVTVNNKNYLLLRQRFHKKINGLKLISGNDEKQFTFSDVRVNDRYNYLLSRSLPVPGGIIIPYSYKREFGFVKIIIE